jgi:hypothetical protein
MQAREHESGTAASLYPQLLDIAGLSRFQHAMAFEVHWSTRLCT